MTAPKKSEVVSFVVRVNSEAERERTLECAHRYGVTAYLVDDVPKKLLPKNLEYLGYVFLKGKPTQLKDFLSYTEHVNTLAKDWVVPVNGSHNS